mgnify:CR=1 FL=1
MKDYTKKQKILIVLGLTLFILIGSGITYAALTWATSNPINIGLTSGCFEINYTPGGAINNANVEVMNESTLISNNKFTITDGIALTYANIGIKSTCSIEGYGSLYLNVTNLSNAFTTGSSKGSLKYAILNNTSTSTPSVTNLKGQSFDIVKKGTITNTGTINILNKKLSNTVQNKYLIVFYIDGSKIGNDVVGASFAGNISADAHQGKAPYEGLAKLIANDTFKSTKTVTLNNVNYKYDDTHKLMEDVAGNIRYYGANPNNYIYFNCSDYSNQSSSTCETWRIIGVFDGKVKIMRNENIGSIPYDNDAENTYLQSIARDNNGNNSRVELLKYNISDEEIIIKLAPEEGTGQNDYSKSSLQKILNNYYYNSLKYTGKYTYDFTSIGFKNDTTRNMIAEITYNLGGHDSTSIYSNQIYSYERGTTVPSGNATTWTGKIAVAYPSDYGYAADLSLCQKQLGSYNDATCTANNWMKEIVAPNYGWLLTPNSAYANYAWTVTSSGVVDYGYYAYIALGVTPVLSLISELDIGPGLGTSSSPYQLSV